MQIEPLLHLESVENTSKNELSKQKTFTQFLAEFRGTLQTLFHDENDINQLSLKRGLPPEILARIMACSPTSVSIPKAYGGRGGTVAESLEVLSVASYESLPLSLMLGINHALFIQPFAKYGQETTKRAVFKRFVDQKNMGGLMITEPDFGTDALSMQCSFTETSDLYHFRGTKHWAGLTGQADFWLLTGRRKNDNDSLQRDVDFFICDTHQKDQKIVVEEYFENLGLYQIPYGRNKIDVKLPKENRLIPHSTGVKMMLDLLHRSRIQFPAMSLGFVKRMLDEAIDHCSHRFVGGKALINYDQVQERLARLQANYTICSAFCLNASKVAALENDLTGFGLEANAIKSVASDIMQESAQSLVQLVGAAAYKISHVGGRGIVDSRPFQIFEGSNDVLFLQIADALVKQMKLAKEFNLYQYLKSFCLTSRVAEWLKNETDFQIGAIFLQRKLVTLGFIISRVISMEYVMRLADSGYRGDLIDSALLFLKQDVSNNLNHFLFNQKNVVVADYKERSDWFSLA